MSEEKREDILEQESTTEQQPDESKQVEFATDQPVVTEPIKNTPSQPVQPITPPQSQYPPNVGTNRQESFYSQQGGGYYNRYQNQQPYYNYGNQTQIKPEEPKNKKKTGLIIFFASLAAIVLISLAAIGGVKLGQNMAGDTGETQNATENSTVNDGPELQINDNGHVSDTGEDVEIKEGQVLTATQIAAKADKISVGVLVYSGGSQSLAGEGTGIVMSLDDKKTYTYIITCAHVVDGTGISITVQTSEGKTYDAEAVGVDERTDIAVLRVKTNELTCASFGSSDNLRVGDTVYAIGNPGGTEFFGSFTSGMVSALDRPVSSEIGYTMKCIQHTAAINPGNSGGALLNSYGQVIGINSSKIVAAEFEGMGFSIPISDAKEIIDKLIKYGRVPDRAKLGISYYTASASEKYSMLIALKDLPAGSLIIGDIAADSDLANKDVMLYDIITAVNGEKLTTSDILLEKIENGKVGDELTLTIARFDNQYNMKTIDVKVKLVEDNGTTEKVEEPTTDFFNPFG